MTQAAPPFRPALLSPLRWPAWIGLGLIWLTARLPYKVCCASADIIGWLSARIVERAPIAERNIEICFPELGADERARLLEENLRDGGMMLVEFALAWMASARAIDAMPFTIEGLEHLEAAHAAGPACCWSARIFRISNCARDWCRSASASPACIA